MAAAVRAIRLKHLREAAMEVFEKYDVDGGGTIDEDELLPALQDLGMPVTVKQCRKVLRKFGGAKAVTEGLNKEQFDQLVVELQRRQREASVDSSDNPDEKKPWHWHNCFPTWRNHERALALYQNRWYQMVVATMIIANFLVNVTEKEIDPFPSHLQKYIWWWEGFDMFFNIIFLFELTLNAWSCGGPYKKFWCSGWNIFDFIVVLVGLMLMTGFVPPSSPLSQLKMMRAFRVFRLFKRIKSLNKVIMALLKAIPGVSNAFIIMVIFMMIYAILAVEYFSPLGQDFCRQRPEVEDCQKARDWEPTGTYVTYGEEINGTVQTHIIAADTPRGFIYGWEYYGTFTRALFTLFQVMTGEGWSEQIARPLMFGLYQDAYFVAFFFVSFILLTQLVLTNVVVAVLLDHFIEDPNAEAKKAAEAAAKELAAKGNVAAEDFLDDDSVVDEHISHACYGSPGSSSPMQRRSSRSETLERSGSSTTLSAGTMSPPAVRSVSSPPEAGGGEPTHLRSISGMLPIVAGGSAIEIDPKAALAMALKPSPAVEDKLDLILRELASLREATSRCERRLDKLSQGEETASANTTGTGASPGEAKPEGPEMEA